MSNEALLGRIARKLAALRWKHVYVGGATTHLYLTDSAAPLVTATEDVDVVIDVRTRAEDLNDLTAALRDAGAKEDTREDAPRCRWILDGIQLDVMPVDDELSGFGNRWYPRVLESAERRVLRDETPVLIPSAVLFLATKLEAFKDRGKGDFLGSKDIEDILALVDGRKELQEEVLASEELVRSFITSEFEGFLRHASFKYAVSGYLRGDAGRSELVLKRVRSIADNGLE